ncbi:hypothetical protein HRG_012738 [Hirsutella rhossiliensis]
MNDASRDATSEAAQPVRTRGWLARSLSPGAGADMLPSRNLKNGLGRLAARGAPKCIVARGERGWRRGDEKKNGQWKKQGKKRPRIRPLARGVLALLRSSFGDMLPSGQVQPTDSHRGLLTVQRAYQMARRYPGYRNRDINYINTYGYILYRAQVPQASSEAKVETVGRLAVDEKYPIAPSALCIFPRSASAGANAIYCMRSDSLWGRMMDGARAGVLEAPCTYCKPLCLVGHARNRTTWEHSLTIMTQEKGLLHQKLHFPGPQMPSMTSAREIPGRGQRLLHPMRAWTGRLAGCAPQVTRPEDEWGSQKAASSLAPATAEADYNIDHTTGRGGRASSARGGTEEGELVRGAAEKNDEEANNLSINTPPANVASASRSLPAPKDQPLPSLAPPRASLPPSTRPPVLYCTSSGSMSKRPPNLPHHGIRSRATGDASKAGNKRHSRPANMNAYCTSSLYDSKNEAGAKTPNHWAQIHIQLLFGAWVGESLPWLCLPVDNDDGPCSSRYFPKPRLVPYTEHMARAERRRMLVGPSTARFCSWRKNFLGSVLVAEEQGPLNVTLRVGCVALPAPQPFHLHLGTVRPRPFTLVGRFATVWLRPHCFTPFLPAPYL